ncbi:hypothetical protein [Thermococcus peptonophilus]|uniref:Uncharacterized protein n=1 Tax=Thermococcus peptonophilus TaxID=53952 RepID=A0A142CW37_9EURY|nr:hypothetical protein [Thermococcus peptonophilus]AMQ18989.1 hypothetical protein A0127_07305 [Thermococcus peptonophilus]
MNKALIIMAVITIALVVYAFETAQLPPASIEYTEVFYVDNQSVTFITQDGFGLFTMKISPHVDNFELKIEFPEGTTYLVRYGSEQFKGETTFKINVHKGDAPQEVYVHFQLPEELTRKVVYEGATPEIRIIGDKVPFWHSEDVIYIKYHKEEKS